MSARNVRKNQLLHFIEGKRAVTPSQVADALGLEIHHVRMLLLRYFRLGLLSRKIISRNTRQRAYSLTEKGKDRITWLENNDPSSLGQMTCAYPRTQ